MWCFFCYIYVTNYVSMPQGRAAAPRLFRRFPASPAGTHAPAPHPFSPDGRSGTATVSGRMLSGRKSRAARSAMSSGVNLPSRLPAQKAGRLHPAHSP